MSILSLPAGFIPQQFEMSLVTNSQTFQSELNGVIQTSALPGDKWAATLAVSNYMGQAAHDLRAFLASLRGRAGRFWMPPFDHRVSSGTALGSGKVNGASQTGSSLVTDGWQPNQTALLLPGDFFQVGYELKMITATAASAGAGAATLTFTPPLRTSPADNADIITTNPCCVMALNDDNQARWAQQPGRIYALTIACTEPLDI